MSGSVCSVTTVSTVSVSTVSTPSLTYSSEENDYQSYTTLTTTTTPTMSQTTDSSVTVQVPSVPVQVPSTPIRVPTSYYSGPPLRTDSAVTAPITINPLFDRLTPRSSVESRDSLQERSSSEEHKERIRLLGLKKQFHNTTTVQDTTSNVTSVTSDIPFVNDDDTATKLDTVSNDSVFMIATNNTSGADSLQSSPGRSEFSFKSPSRCQCTCKCGDKDKISPGMMMEGINEVVEEVVVLETSEGEFSDDKTRCKKNKVKVRRRKVDDTTDTELSYYYDSSDKQQFQGSYGRCYGSCDVSNADDQMPNSGQLLQEVNMFHFKNVEGSGTMSKSINDLGLASDVIHPENVVELERGGHVDLWRERPDWEFAKYLPLYADPKCEETTTISTKNDMLKYFGKHQYASKSVGAPSHAEWKDYLEWKSSNMIQWENLKSTSYVDLALIKRREAKKKAKVIVTRNVEASSSSCSTSVSSDVTRRNHITCVVNPSIASRQTNVHTMRDVADTSSESVSVEPVPLVSTTTVVTTTTNQEMERRRKAKEAKRHAERLRIMQKKADKKRRLKMRELKRTNKRSDTRSMVKEYSGARVIYEVGEKQYNTTYSCDDAPPVFHRPLYLDLECTIPVPQRGDPNRLPLLTLSSKGELNSRSSVLSETRTITKKVTPHRPVTLQSTSTIGGHTSSAAAPISTTTRFFKNESTTPTTGGFIKSASVPITYGTSTQQQLTYDGANTTTTPYHETATNMRSPIMASSTTATTTVNTSSYQPSSNLTATSSVTSGNFSQPFQGGSSKFTQQSSLLIPGGRCQSYLNGAPNVERSSTTGVNEYMASLHRGSSSEPIRGQSWMYNYNNSSPIGGTGDDHITGYSIKTVAVVDGEGEDVASPENVGYSIPPTTFVPTAKSNITVII